MDVIPSVNELDADTMITDMLENIRDRGQFRPSINRREARYKIYDCFKQRQVEWKGELLSTQKWVKVYTSYLRLLLMNLENY